MQKVSYQTTLRQSVKFSGKAVFSGEETSITLFPAPANYGIVFEADGVLIPAHIDYVATEFTGRTALKKDGACVSMVEHLLAALSGLEVDNVRVRVEGNEIPMLDGSALLFIREIDHIGLQTLSVERRQVKLTEPVYWSDETARLVALPSNKFSLSYTWHAPESQAFRSAFWEGVVDPDTIRNELGGARTFGFENQVNQAIQAGLIRGAGLERGILIRNNDQIVNKEGLRWPDELVRHKALDVVGDLSLVGVRVFMHVIALRSGHSANIQLARKLIRVLEKERLNEPPIGQADSRYKANREDSSAPLSVFAD